MSSHSPRRPASNKKSRGGGSFHYRPKNKNGSGPGGNNGQGGNKSGSTAKYRDKPHGMDGGPSDDGGVNDSDDRHNPYSKTRTRYENRYDRFGSISPHQSPKFGGQRPGNRRGSGGSSDRPPAQNNRRGGNRTKFSGRGSYDDDDEEEAFGRGRQVRNQHKRNMERNPYGRDYGRDRDVRRTDDRREVGDDFSGARERRYGYNDGERYRGQRSQPHRTTQPSLDGLINIFHQFSGDDENDGMEEEAIDPPPGLFDARTNVYPVDYLMSLRKKPQHRQYEGPVLPDSVNRNLNPTPPPQDTETMGMYGRRPEPSIPNRRTEAPERSWRKSPNVVPRQREDPPKGELGSAADGGADGDEAARPRLMPMKPPMPHRSAKPSLEGLDTMVAGVKPSEEEDHVPNQKTGTSNSRETPEWDAPSAPQDFFGFGSKFQFKQLDRDRDLKSLETTGRLLAAEEAVIEEDERDVDNGDGSNGVERSDGDGANVVFGSGDGRRGDRHDENNSLPPVPGQAVDSTALENEMGRGRLDEDEVSDEEVLKKQFEEMNNVDDEDDDGDVSENILMQGPRMEEPDLSTIENNPWEKGDAGLMNQPPTTTNGSGPAFGAADLDVNAVIQDVIQRHETSQEEATETGFGLSSPPHAVPVVSVKKDSSSGKQQQHDQQSPAKVTPIVLPSQSGTTSASPQKGTEVSHKAATGEEETGGGETSGKGGGPSPGQTPTEEQFRLYEEKVRQYYYQAVMFHQKYKKYQKLYTHAHEMMVADPSQRDPLMDKYIEKYQQHRQRFQLVYDKYRKYQAYLEHFGRKVSMGNFQSYPGRQEGGRGDPRQPYYGPQYASRQPNGDPRYEEHGGMYGPDPRYAGPSGADPSSYYSQQYYADRPPRGGYPDDGYGGHHQDPRSHGQRYGPPGPHGGPHGMHGPPAHMSSRGPTLGPPRSREEFYGRGPPPGHGPPPGWHSRGAPGAQPIVPHVKGSSALKIEKPPRPGGSQPNMEDDTKTTPPDAVIGKGETGGEVGSTSPNEKEKPSSGPASEHFGSPGEGNNPREYHEPREYPSSHGYYYPDRVSGGGSGGGDGIDLGLGDLGYTTAPAMDRDRDRERDRRDPGQGHHAFSGHSGRGPYDGMDRSDMERAQANQYADDYMKYYSRSSGGGMTRAEYEDYQKNQKRHQYLQHFRRHGYYPGGGPHQGGGGYGMPPAGAGGRPPPSRMDVASPPMRQPSPGNPNDPYYNSYGPQYEQEQYYHRASPQMMQGDYPHYYSSHGPRKPDDY